MGCGASKVATDLHTKMQEATKKLEELQEKVEELEAENKRQTEANDKAMQEMKESWKEMLKKERKDLEQMLLRGWPTVSSVSNTHVTVGHTHPPHLTMPWQSDRLNHLVMVKSSAATEGEWAKTGVTNQIDVQLPGSQPAAPRPTEKPVPLGYTKNTSGQNIY